MRRIILLGAVMVLVLLFVAPDAGAIPKEAKGCPSDSSVWLEVSHPNDPGVDWENTSFWQWYSALPGALDVWYEAGYTDHEEIYWFFLMNRVDRNDDDAVCAWHIGSIPGVPDDYISIVDNNANATT
jgi:hypothetical protein